ncbi:uncharacterized protein LOC130981532 [Arachis stenosperma]|uniref:uncharacterized protein LOC130981532 n=1 Tax=Arachis stenosperma TaxID=217475 RepID=UPI0025AC2300|nr:uncharacterized protein LOC130981532 [Arachis stenosperma]
MMRQHRPDIAILLETKCSGDTAKRVIHNLGFSYSILEEAQGFVGGIWICWNRPDINITTIENHSQYLHVKIQTQSEKEWFLTAVYASPQSQNRRELWPKILNIANQIMGDWLIAGDFNEIKDNSEKKGGATISNRDCNVFSGWINRWGLIDLGFIGSRYTWRGPQWEGQDRVFKRLDRALANHSWRIRFHEAVVEVLARTEGERPR